MITTAVKLVLANPQQTSINLRLRKPSTDFDKSQTSINLRLRKRQWSYPLSL
jgi:hypothetical protein